MQRERIEGRPAPRYEVIGEAGIEAGHRWRDSRLVAADLSTGLERSMRSIIHLALDNAAPIIDSPINHLWEHRLLFGVTPTDVPTYAAVIAVLFAAAVVATWIPARRALRIDPMLALRAD